MPSYKKESTANPQSSMARSGQRQPWLMAASPRSWPQMGAGAGGGGQESEPSPHRPPSHIFYTSPPLQSLPRLKTRNKHRDSLLQTIGQMGRGVKPHFADSAQTEYCPTFHCPCVRAFVTGVTSHISHIYKGINAMLIIRGPIKPYTF